MPTKGKIRIFQIRGGQIFYWLLVLFVLGLLAWLFWKHSQVQNSNPTAKPLPTHQPRLPSLAQPATNNLQPATRNTPHLTPLSQSTPAQTTATSSNNVPQENPVGRERNLRAQVALVRQGISPGSLDGLIGPQTHAAVRAFQQKEKLPATGDLDPNTLERLIGPEATYRPLSTSNGERENHLYTPYIVTETDLAALQPLGQTWLAKSLQNRLDYETLLELVAEKSQSHPNLIRWLNPGITWSNLAPGTALKIPSTELPSLGARAAYVKISLSARILEAFDEETNLLAHFPCSIGQRMEQRPLGELHVLAVAFRPNYTFDPDVFPESAEGRELGRKLILPPGPNNPVGAIWIGLDKPGYGIHGTPRPEQVGRTESHGCFRLANWNAEFLARMVWVGMPVWVE